MVIAIGHSLQRGKRGMRRCEQAGLKQLALGDCRGGIIRSVPFKLLDRLPYAGSTVGSGLACSPWIGVGRGGTAGGRHKG